MRGLFAVTFVCLFILAAAAVLAVVAMLLGVFRLLPE